MVDTEVSVCMSQNKYEKKIKLIHEDLKEKLTCCVCNDIFQTFNRCTHGHGICEFCYENVHEAVCPLCRDPLSEVPESITSNLADKLELKVECCTCNNLFDIKKIEHHRNWCEEQLFTCPSKDMCNKMLKSSELYDHLLHHDRNIVIVEDINDILFTFINSSENHILVLLKKTKHVIDISWCGLRSDVGRPLLSISAKCYYPDKESNVLSVHVSHYNILSKNLKPVECFSLNRIDPMFSSKEPSPPVPFGIITPVLKILNERQYADIKILKDESCISNVYSEYKRDVVEFNKTYTRETRRRQFMSIIFAQRDAVAFLGIRFSLEDKPVSESP
jgi:hypothetical protein